MSDFSAQLQQEQSFTFGDGDLYFEPLRTPDPFISNGILNLDLNNKSKSQAMDDFEQYFAELGSSVSKEVALFEEDMFGPPKLSNNTNILPPSKNGNQVIVVDEETDSSEEGEKEDQQTFLATTKKTLLLQKKPPAVGQLRKLVMTEEDTHNLIEMLEPGYQQVQRTGLRSASRSTTHSGSVSSHHDISPSPSPAPGGGPIRASGATRRTSQPGPGRPLNSVSKSGSSSRQALYAREYRQKNKELLESLENQVHLLNKQNAQLINEKNQIKHEMVDLKAEVQYLRNVLANESSLAPLLATISNAPGMKLQFPAKPDVVGGLQQQQQQTTSNGAGLCVHVVDNNVSVELCARCNRQARSVPNE